MDNDASFGYWIRRRRKALDLTQEELARRVACALDTIRKIEADARRPSRQVAERLAEALAVPNHGRTAFLQAARGELPMDRLSLPPAVVAGAPLARSASAAEPPTPAIANSRRAVSTAGLPSGTVTFFCTDIEGSTQLWERHPEAMGQALARHDAILQQIIAAHGGVVFKTSGDGAYAVFTRAHDALNAAVAAQHALVAESWRATGPLRVRIVLHTGATQERDEDYFGPPLNRAARLLAVGHGGQILLSRATEELVCDTLPALVTLRDLGTHRLKDLLRPEHIFQLIVQGLPDTFPPLKTLDAHPTNLPTQATTLIGRERDIVAARDLVQRDEVRLLTLTGPGGTGKTRLALQVAAELLDTFVDGVYVVALAPINDANLVASTIVQTLGVREARNVPLLECLKDYLRAKHMLLVLDNFEQVLQATSLVGELLTAASKLKVLVTSRAVLHLYGEHEFAVAPLALPDVRQLPSLERLTQYDSVRLFIERAQAVKANFTFTNHNASAVAEICARLDGLPLALELAAARSKLFPPQALLARLSQRFKLLVGGAQNLPVRQQTLRSTVDWSYNLLHTGEQALFRSLAVFVGGFSIEAAEAVCATDSDLPFSVLEGMVSLVDNSLLRQEQGSDGEPRFLMLETIREYALEKLVEQSEIGALQRRHAAYYLALAERADVELRGAHMLAWLARLNQENDNLRTTLSWYQSQADGIEANVRLAGALWLFWFLQGLLTEGRAWLHSALARFQQSDRDASAKYAWAAGGAGMLAWLQGDWSEATALGETALAYGQRAGERQVVADALYLLSQCAIGSREHARALDLASESLGLQRAGGDQFRVGIVLLRLGWLNHQLGMVDQAQACMKECDAVSRSLGNPFLRAGILGLFAYVATRLGDDARARTYYEESVAVLRAMGEHYNLMLQLFSLGDIAWRQRDGEQAARWYREGLALAEEMGHKSGRAQAMYLLGALARQQGDAVRAQAYYEEGLGIFQELGDQAGIADTQASLGFVALQQDNAEHAAACFRKGMEAGQHVADQARIGLNILGLAGVAIRRGQPVQAARLLSAAQQLLESGNAGLNPADRTEYEQIRDAVRADLDSVSLTSELATGRALTFEQAIAEAIAVSTT